MAVNTKTSTTARNAELDALAALLNNGYIRIYDGAQPANADTAITSQVLLAELRFGATAFGAASGGVITANAITGDASANATGTASWVRMLKSDGTTVVYDGNVGTGGTFDLVLTGTTTITIGLPVNISSLTYTLPA